MSNTPNLDIPLVETQQLQPEVTMNSGILAFERAITESAEIECVDGINTVTSAEAREHLHLLLVDGSPATSTAFDVVMPAIKRMVIVTNDCDYSATVSCDGAATGASEAVVAAGTSSYLYCDGAQVFGMTASALGVGFSDLSDAPASYSGQAGKIVVVAEAEDAVEFKSARELPLEINAQTGTSYTLALSDAGLLVTLDNGSAITVTVPEDGTTDFPVGTQILLAQLDDGQVTVVGESTSVDLITPETASLAKLGATASLVKIAANTWLMAGNLEASA